MFYSKSGSKTLDSCSVDIVKGYTKASVIMFVLMALSELDVNNAEDWEKCRPFVTFLDKAFLLPTYVP